MSIQGHFTIDVCGIPYEVWHVGKERFPDESRDGYYGISLHTKQEIYIDANQAPAQRRATLLHELIHAVEAQNGMNLREQSVKILALGLSVALYKMGFYNFDLSSSFFTPLKEGEEE